MHTKSQQQKIEYNNNSERLKLQLDSLNFCSQSFRLNFESMHDWNVFFFTSGPLLKY